MSLDVRSARLIVLGAWSLCLLWLWTSGEVARYLGPRTFWVVPFGGLALAAVTAAYWRLSREMDSERAPLGLRQSAGLVALLVPALVAFTMAGAALGSLAASKKLSSRGVDLSRLASHLSPSGAKAGFLELNVAGRDEGYAARSGVAPGRRITLTGFVIEPPSGPGEPFEVARFYILCCVADAVAIKARVYPVGSPAASVRKDKWLEVTGEIVRRDGRLGVLAESIQPTKEPKNPYLSFSG